MRIKTFRVEYLKPFEALDEEAVTRYYTASNRVSLLDATIRKTFRDAVLNSTGYSDDNIPPEPVITTLLEDADFPIKIKSLPTKKRPPVKDVYLHFKFFLKEIETEYDAKKQRKGVLTIDGKPYISVDFVQSKIEEKQEEITGPGVKHEPTFPDITDDILGSIENGVTIDLDGRYWEINHANTILYAKADRLVTHFNDRIVKPFEEEIKKKTGWSKENPPETQTEYYEQLGSHLFRITTIPKRDTNYNSVVKGLVGPKTKTGKIGKTTGDLVRIKDDIEDERTGQYEIRKREETHFISLESLKKRLEELEKEATTITIRQPIEHYPLV